ncbi:lipoyl domain-containing protein [Halomarina ordinaria]|uniref:Lipoyl domain-containing protein n=1 Tax=Halomarina ordinaria TaxID=3033939 RepID=A0ABD5U838_9EURY|nr:lipoyl domain-containing protein [Halomarina sp. PSRA2]
MSRDEGEDEADRVALDSGAVWPADADDVEEAVVANWFVREGGRVEADAVVCEIQVEKVSIDVPSPVTGTLAEVLVAENESFARGDPLAYVTPA